MVAALLKNNNAEFKGRMLKVRTGNDTRPRPDVLDYEETHELAWLQSQRGEFNLIIKFSSQFLTWQRGRRGRGRRHY